MKDRLQDILSRSGKPVDQQKLISYLNGELPPNQAQEIEEQLAVGEFEQEALEGLENVSDKSTINAIASSLQKDLKRKIKQQRNKRLPLLAGQESLIYMVLVILLLLVILSYWIIRHVLTKG